jgi:hypothetical protein
LNDICRIRYAKSRCSENLITRHSLEEVTRRSRSLASPPFSLFAARRRWPPLARLQCVATVVRRPPLHTQEQRIVRPHKTLLRTVAVTATLHSRPATLHNVRTLVQVRIGLCIFSGHCALAGTHHHHSARARALPSQPLTALVYLAPSIYSLGHLCQAVDSPWAASDWLPTVPVRPRRDSLLSQTRLAQALNVYQQATTLCCVTHSARSCRHERHQPTASASTRPAGATSRATAASARHLASCSNVRAPRTHARACVRECE